MRFGKVSGFLNKAVGRKIGALEVSDLEDFKGRVNYLVVWQ